MNKFYGMIRDTNYYLFKAGGWKWLMTIAILLNLARCGIEIDRISLAPNCTAAGVKIGFNGITETQRCKASKEGEKFLCQLLQLDLEEDKTKLP